MDNNQQKLTPDDGNANSKTRPGHQPVRPADRGSGAPKAAQGTFHAVASPTADELKAANFPLPIAMAPVSSENAKPAPPADNVAESAVTDSTAVTQPDNKAGES